MTKDVKEWLVIRPGACMPLNRAAQPPPGEWTADARSFTAGCQQAKTKHRERYDGEIRISRVLCGYGDSDQLGPGPIVAIFPGHTPHEEVTMTLSCRLFTVAISMGLILGCGSGSPAPKAKDAAPGRPETRVVEGAAAAGYNGSQMRKKIDKVIDRTEERSREIEKGAAGAQPK